MQKVLKEEKFPIDEIYVTEWNFTISNRNCINDSCAQAAYIIKNCIEAEGEIPLMAYWHGTDLHSEFFDTESIINGDSGLLTRDGIKKPSFYAFQFLHLLQNQLLGKNESSILTTNGRGNYTIVCHNSKNLTYRYAVKEENKIQIEEQNELFDDLEPTQLNFQINQVENGDYLVKIHYINQEIGSVQDTWKDMEYIPNLSKSEIDYLKRSSMPHIEMKRIQVEDNTLRIETRLQPHEIRILRIVYQF
jgi:beta-xylosidase